MSGSTDPQPHRRLPMGVIIGLTVGVTVFAGLVAAWMYWLAVLF